MPNFKNPFTFTPKGKKINPTDTVTIKFSKAWAFTAGWEGKWDGEKKPFRLDDSIASYGVTPRFLVEYVGYGKTGGPNPKLPTKAFMATIDYNKAGEIWYNSRWKWYKCEDIESDEIALLVFDWAVRRPAPVAYKLAEIVGLPGSVHKVKTNDFGGNAGPDDKSYYLSEEVIRAINAACKENGTFSETKIKNLYDKIIQTRAQTETNLLPGVKRRLGCMLFGEFSANEDTFNDLPKARKEQLVKGVEDLANKKGLIVRKQPDINDDTEGGMSFTKMAAWGIGIFFGGKWFKLW